MRAGTITSHRFPTSSATLAAVLRPRRREGGIICGESRAAKNEIRVDGPTPHTGQELAHGDVAREKVAMATRANLTPPPPPASFPSSPFAPAPAPGTCPYSSASPRRSPPASPPPRSPRRRRRLRGL